MKVTYWISHAACVLIGVLVGFALQADDRPGSYPAVLLDQTGPARLSEATSPSTSALTTMGPRALAGPPLPASQSGARPTAGSSPPARDAGWAAAYQRGASDYGASFQPGVVSEEPLPQYMAAYFDSNLKGHPVLEDHMRHMQEPADAWSNEMETRLRSYFQSQPEIANLRISISCRTSGCELQTAALADESSGSTAMYTMYTRLTREAWFAEQFAPGRGLNGAGGAAVGYRLSSLPRRK